MVTRVWCNAKDLARVVWVHWARGNISLILSFSRWSGQLNSKRLCDASWRLEVRENRTCEPKRADRVLWSNHALPTNSTFFRLARRGKVFILSFIQHIIGKPQTNDSCGATWHQVAQYCPRAINVNSICSVVAMSSLEEQNVRTQSCVSLLYATRSYMGWQTSTVIYQQKPNNRALWSCFYEKCIVSLSAKSATVEPFELPLLALKLYDGLTRVINDVWWAYEGNKKARPEKILDYTLHFKLVVSPRQGCWNHNAADIRYMYAMCYKGGWYGHSLSKTRANIKGCLVSFRPENPAFRRVTIVRYMKEIHCHALHFCTSSVKYLLFRHQEHDTEIPIRTMYVELRSTPAISGLVSILIKSLFKSSAWF